MATESAATSSMATETGTVPAQPPAALHYNSPLVRLPDELKIRMFEYAGMSRRHTLRPATQGYHTDNMRRVALLCHDLYGPVTEVFYKDNFFVAQYGKVRLRVNFECLKSITSDEFDWRFLVDPFHNKWQENFTNLYSVKIVLSSEEKDKVGGQGQSITANTSKVVIGKRKCTLAKTNMVLGGYWVAAMELA